MTLIHGDAVDMSAFAYARGAAPDVRARLRSSPADFFVDEDCDIALSGSGEHLWCRIEKSGLNTQDAVQALSRATGVHPRQIGFAGMKDRVAVTRQWLSIACPEIEILSNATFNLFDKDLGYEIIVGFRII